MAVLDVRNVRVVEFYVDTTVTCPDGTVYTANAGSRYGVPSDQGETMIVNPGGDVKCQTEVQFESNPEIMVVNTARAAS